MTAALPACLLESFFYLASVFTAPRNWFHDRYPRPVQAALLWISALLPYLILSLGTGTFHRNSFTLAVMLFGVASFWHAFMPRRIAYDVGYLVVVAAPFISGVFKRIYISPDPHLHADALAHVTWIRVALIAVLVLREWNPGPFSMWPTLREWRAGMAMYAAALVPIALVAASLHFVAFAPSSGPWWKMAGLVLGYFLGTLWVLAVGEELFFRGVILRAMLTHWPSAAWVAILTSSILFGCAHLWYRAYPNWRFALVAGLAGIAYGIAYVRTGSVRAPMVTHALIVTTWKMLFR